MSLPLAQLFRGMPRQIIPSHAPPINQPITDGTSNLPLIQPKDPSKQDAAAHQPPPGSSSLLPSPLQHQTHCLQAFYKTVQQFHQHLKTEQLDQKTLQLNVLQLQNEFPLLRYLLFSSVRTILTSDTSVTNSTTSPLTNPNPNPNPTSTALLLPCTDEPKFRRSTPEGAVGSPRAKTNNAANAIFLSSPNTREAPPTQMQHLTSRIFKFEKDLRMT